MKFKLLWIIVVFTLFLGFVVWYATPIIQEPLPTKPLTGSLNITPTPTRTEQTIEWNNRRYAYALIHASPSQITLIPNYEEKKEFSNVLMQAHCNNGTSGGFYDQNSEPLGLVVSNGNLVNPSIQSSLFNGFFSLSKTGIASISSEIPKNPALALQSGPFLIDEAVPIALTIREDTYERRVAVGVTSKGQVVFIAVYDPDAEFEGPLLTDLPSIIATISKNEALQLTRALNLDGGTASAFDSRDVVLSELKPVGAVLCARF